MAEVRLRKWRRERLGAECRSPTRVHPGRLGEPHTMVVYVLPVTA